MITAFPTINHPKFKDIVKLAANVRKKAERYALINNYNSNLANLCMIASYAVGKEMMKLGLRPRFIEGEDPEKDCCFHCWIEWRGLIIDITATQFECMDDVFISEINYDWNAYKHFNYVYCYRTIVPFYEKDRWKECTDVENPLNYRNLLNIK